MPFQYPSSGQANVAEYMMSGLPFATSSTAPNGGPISVDFPFVTKNFTIQNIGATYLAVGFTRNGLLGSNKFTIAPSSSFKGDFRVKTLFFMGVGGNTNFELIAGLTLVNTRSFPVLTSSSDDYNISSSLYSGYFAYGGI